MKAEAAAQGQATARAHEVWRAAVGTWHRANVLFVCVPGARPPAPPATEGRKATC